MVGGGVCDARMVISTAIVEIRVVSGGRRWEWSAKGLNKDVFFIDFQPDGRRVGVVE